MSCEINKTSRQYNLELEAMDNDDDFSRINTCVQSTIDHVLKKLASSQEDPTYSLSSQKDELTFRSMNEKSLELYSKNFYYIIFKLSIFIVLFYSYYLLTK
jgi:hypothetical protein